MRVISVKGVGERFTFRVLRANAPASCVEWPHDTVRPLLLAIPDNSGDYASVHYRTTQAVSKIEIGKSAPARCFLAAHLHQFIYRTTQAVALSRYRTTQAIYRTTQAI
ncbi:hypothetical protein [Deinococcus hohokamensis]|uniref:Transposase n=1 Tax=Deinococcus hohokamensis TaxID=309883 RepID=A0ABV9IAG9_9DEIO